MTLTVTFSEFLGALTGNPLLLVTVLLTLGVILVNGWTDAPNAIATCVSTRAMPVRAAILMAALLNFAGVLVMTLLSPRVAATIYHMVDFGTDTHEASVALCAALVSIVVWATAAWRFGIPTSESHALIAGLSGAAIALHGDMGGINGAEWVRVLYGLVISTVLSFVIGFLTVRALEAAFRRSDRRRVRGFFQIGQIAAGGATAFMHGAQDGQKFMGVFLLGFFLVQGQQGENFAIPLWLMILCSLVMGLGTSIGGERIIKSVGMDMVKLQPHQGLAADLAATGCLLLCSLLGVPVSTTNTKTTAIMGIGASKRLSAVNWSIVREMLLAWVLTFPGCGLLGWAVTRLFMWIF